MVSKLTEDPLLVNTIIWSDNLKHYNCTYWSIWELNVNVERLVNLSGLTQLQCVVDYHPRVWVFFDWTILFWSVIALLYLPMFQITCYKFLISLRMRWIFTYNKMGHLPIFIVMSWLVRWNMQTNGFDKEAVLWTMHSHPI